LWVVRMREVGVRSLPKAIPVEGFWFSSAPFNEAADNIHRA